MPTIKQAFTQAAARFMYGDTNDVEFLRELVKAIREYEDFHTYGGKEDSIVPLAELLTSELKRVSEEGKVLS